VKLQRATGTYAQSNQPGRTLVLTGLDAIRTLRSLTLRGEVHRLAIEGDDRIVSLRGLLLPRSVTELEVTRCLSFSSLDGAEDLAGSRLEKFELAIVRLSGSFEEAVAPLFRTGHDRYAPLIEQLRHIHISSPGGAEVGAFIKRLTELDFKVKSIRPMHHVITARR